MLCTRQPVFDMTLSRTTIFINLILTTCILVMPIAVRAQGGCEAPLKDGVFNRLDLRKNSYSSVAFRLAVSSNDRIRS